MALSHNDLNTLQRIMDKAEPGDWKVINQIMRDASNNMQTKAIVAIRADVGDKVEWDSKTGSTLRGKIQKINRKTIIVKTETGSLWKVSPSMLRKVA